MDPNFGPQAGLCAKAPVAINNQARNYNGFSSPETTTCTLLFAARPYLNRSSQTAGYLVVSGEWCRLLASRGSKRPCWWIRPLWSLGARDS